MRLPCLRCVRDEASLVSTRRIWLLEARGSKLVAGRNAVQEKAVSQKLETPGDYLTIAMMRTGASPGLLFFAGAMMTSEPVAGKEVKRAAPSTT